MQEEENLAVCGGGSGVELAAAPLGRAHDAELALEVLDGAIGAAAVDEHDLCEEREVAQLVGKLVRDIGLVVEGDDDGDRMLVNGRAMLGKLAQQRHSSAGDVGADVSMLACVLGARIEALQVEEGVHVAAGAQHSAAEPKLACVLHDVAQRQAGPVAVDVEELWVRSAQACEVEAAVIGRAKDRRALFEDVEGIEDILCGCLDAVGAEHHAGVEALCEHVCEDVDDALTKAVPALLQVAVVASGKGCLKFCGDVLGGTAGDDGDVISLRLCFHDACSEVADESVLECSALLAGERVPHARLAAVFGQCAGEEYYRASHRSFVLARLMKGMPDSPCFSSMPRARVSARSTLS